MAAAQNAKFRVLAADKLDEEGLEYIRSQPDAELINKPGITEEELAKIAGDADGMIVRSAVQVTAKVLANPGRLKVVARAGVGVDNIDLEAATDKGILVMNSADASTISTAEHAFALLISLARQIGPAYKTMSEGGWDRSKFMGRQLSGKTLGVVGFGRIGRTVAERALAFGMNVVAYDPVFNQPTALDGKVRVFQQFKDILPHADMLTFHVPLTDQTRGMLGAETFPLCKKGVMVVNASRGGVVDEDSLIAAIDAGQCGGAALDVYTTEPPAKDSPLRKHPKILLTPHLGASTKEAQKAVAVAAAEQLMTFLRGQGIVGAVNAGGLRIDLTPLQNAFVDLAQRMTKLLAPMITQGIGSVTIELSGKELAAASGTIERYALVGLLGSSLDVPVNVINVAHVARQRGVQLRTVLTDGQEDQAGTPELTIEVASPDGKEKRRIVGHIYDDMRPRVEEINGYRMDMIPAGAMVLILNEDRPGMIGLVGTEFGQAQVNIADMTISRRESKAMMVLKVDQEPAEALLNRLTHRPGILKVAVIRLPAEKLSAR
ncbi:MAG: phosphoglycerate dehydrogenase [Phycisphaeraceae bacterium]|nr:phosphoglycerate dehydrogenase [Phycisphaeraceae bacterium]